MDNYKQLIEPTEEQIVRLNEIYQNGLHGRVINISGLSIIDWLILRTIPGIGSSEVATALGYAPAFFSKTPLSLWKEKVSNIVELIDTPTLRIGRNVEEVIIQEYEYLTGRKVQRVKDKMFLHQDYDFLFSDLDGIILPAGGDGYGILECKSTISYVYDSWISKLPSYYFRQVMQELAVLEGSEYDPQYVEIATLILDKREVKIIRLDKDSEFIKSQTVELVDWYNNYVINNTPPPESVAEWAKTTPMEDSFIEADDKTYQAYLDLKKVQSQKNIIEEEEQALKDKLIAVIKDNELLTYGGDIIATYKQQSKTTVDSKKLKAEHPEVYGQCSNISTSRVLRLKKLQIVEY
jgi:predicted phage-related endonuclease